MTASIICFGMRARELVVLAALLGAVALVAALPCNAAGCAPKASKCAVCEAFVEAVDREVEQKEDEDTRTKKVGWRTDSRGKRVQKTIPWVRSEEGIAATLDASCRKIMNLTESTRGDGSINLFQGPSEHFKLGGYKLDMYMRSCFDLTERFDEELVAALGAGSALRPLPQLVHYICAEVSGFCPRSRWAKDARFKLPAADGAADEAAREAKDELR